MPIATAPRPVRCPYCRRCLLLAAPPIAHVSLRCPNCRSQIEITGADTLTATVTHEGPGRSRAPPKRRPAPLPC